MQILNLQFIVVDTDIPDLSDDVVSSLRSEDQKAAQLYEDIQRQKELIHQKVNTTFGERLKNFAINKYATFYRRYDPVNCFVLC